MAFRLPGRSNPSTIRPLEIGRRLLRAIDDNVDIDNDSDIAFGFGGHVGLAYYLQPNLSVYAQLFNNIYFAHGDTTHRGFGLGLSLLF